VKQTNGAASRPKDTQDSNPDAWLRRLARYCWRHKRSMMLALAGALAATLATAAIPLILGLIVDDTILTHHAPVWAGALVLIAAGLLNFAGVYTRRYEGGKLSLDVQHDMRTESFAALAALDGARQDQLRTGQVVSRAISDLNMVQGLLGMLPMLLGSALLFVLSVTIMTVLSPLLTVVALAIGPALWLIALRSRLRLFPASWDAQQQAANVAGVVEGAVTGVRVVKGFGQEDQEIGRLEDASSALFASRVRAVRLMARYNPALQAVPLFGQVGVLALGGWLTIRGSIPLGTFLAFSLYVAQMISPVRALAALVTIGQEARASVIRIFEVMDARPVITERPGAVPLPPGAQDVELDRVEFGYQPDQPVLRGLSLHVPPGQTLALVGTSGSGKSTISLLLPRFYDITGGAIRIGGHDVRDLTTDSLRAAIGLVPEDSFLFSATVRDNIAYGHPEATDAEVEAAARAAQAHDFIMALPDGYATVVGEQGLTLSGGQRQRVCLARALVTDPAVLVLDDATSAVDANIEARIHDALRSAMAGRTTLLIAHRQSTLALADQIAVLDAGRLADLGTHEELSARCPLYRLLLSGTAGNDAPPVPAHGDGAEVITSELWGSGRRSQQHRLVAGRGAAFPASDASAAKERRRSEEGRQRPSSGPARAAGTATGGHMGAMLGSLPPTPELLAKVEALPPAQDRPGVSEDTARAPDARFTLRRLLRPVALALLGGLVLDGLDALAGVAFPALVRGGVDHGVVAGQFHPILLVSLAGLAIVLADWVISAVQTVVVGRNGERLLYTLRVKIFAHLQRLGLDFYERSRSGQIMTRMTTDVDALSSFLQTGLITMVNSLLTFAGVLIALLFINARLGLTLLAIVPVLAVVTVVFRIKSSRAYTEARERVSVVNADFQENVAGLRITQAYRREPRNASRFAGLSSGYRQSRLRAQRYIALYFPFVQLLSTVAGALVLFTAAGQVRTGALTAGGLVAFLLYIDLLFAPVQQLSQVFDGYQQAAVGLRRIKDLLRTPTSTPQAQQPRRPGRPRGLIEFRGVHFRYPGQPADALNGVSLTIEPGETVALVGQTGAGKSTMVKLVARFYDVTAGQVLIDGTDLRELDLAAYRHGLGVVPQEPYLSPGTVRDAIAYGRPGATDAEVEAAARAVGALGMIARLSGGFRHEVAERGRNLSAGQRQLIALARAYLVDPGILLLDEATAALDLAAEAEVIAATERLAAQRTTLVVAHRLTTAARADRIVLMADGQIAEIGSHDELLAAGGRYAELWAAFMGGAELAA
jgi:ATP-binding cassette, subfamily B, bacterial